MNEVITAISPARPDRISLDFERLRAEGIKRLEDWAPFIWTDFNVHDPGITILEVLCYAITDLAYRTRLPIEDLLASGPDGMNTKKFFEGEEILPSCPVTTNDYRKLIIDIPGIKNAWFEKAGAQLPKVCIKKERMERPMSPKLSQRLSSLFDDNDTPKKLTAFEQTLINIGNAETIPEGPKDQMGEIYQRFLFQTKSIKPEDIAFFRQSAEDLDNDNDRENLLLLADRIALFMTFYNCNANYYVVDFKRAEKEVLAELSEIIAPLSTKDIKQKLNSILLKLDPKHKKGFNMSDMIQLWEYIDFLSLNAPDDAYLVFNLANEITCQLSCYALNILDEDAEPPTNCEILEYNGLYKVKLDFHDPCIEPGSKEEKRIIKSVLHKLHQNRNLCEDFVEICAVEKQSLCLCLDVETTTTSDENEVMAEIMFQLQEFLTPTIRFNSLQQLLEKGWTGDEILNGPLLDHGFITDDELDRGMIPDAIFVSDLYNIILNVKGVLSINEFAVKKSEEEDYIKDLTCIELEGKKPVLDLCCSYLYITREGFTSRIPEKEIIDIIEFKQLVFSNPVGNPNEKLPIPKGIYHEDLAEFTSVQSDFPQNYGLAENGVPSNASSARKAQIKQLQAYLTFYDRLMGNYMQQLSHVKDILAVEQDAKASTYFYDSLYHVSGIKELIFQPVIIGSNQLNQLGRILPEEIYDLIAKSDLIDQPFYAFGEWNNALGHLLGHHWSDNGDIRTMITEIIQSDYTTSHWENFLANDQNYYIQQLKDILEPGALQEKRKNQILDHLLARFGEQFTNFSLQQYGIGEEVSLYDNHCDYLIAKSNYLKHIPVINAEKAKAYNCQQFIYGEDGVSDKESKSGVVPKRPDVWNTDNVAGLKKKIYHLLNIQPVNTSSIFCDPNYRIDLEADETADRPRFFIQMVELDENKSVKSILLMSTKTYSGNQARIRQQKLNEFIGKQQWYKIVSNDSDSKSYMLQFSFEDGSDTTVLQSEKISHSQAESLMDKIAKMIDPDACDEEGFHLIEHILLRPFVNDDQLLQHSFTCDLSLVPIDPYSFWLTLVIPGWTNRFKDPVYRKYFEQLVRKETPAHIALCFRWLENENKVAMKKIEDALEHWREAKAYCEPDACELSDHATQLINLLNCFPCSCYCHTNQPPESLCGCDEDVVSIPEIEEPNSNLKK